MNEPNLKDVEKRTYISYHQDGLIDIFIGTYILLFATAILVNNILDLSTWFVIPAMFPALLVPIWIALKKRITVPRIGYVKFKASGANKVTAVFIGTLVAGVFTFFLFAFVSTQTWALELRNIIIQNGVLFIGLGTFIISSLFGYTIGLKRLYGYGVLALILFGLLYFITFPFEYVLFAIGLIKTNDNDSTICYRKRRLSISSKPT
ncbi:MAG: hypothetical protein P8Y18_03135 [Candidatus Bathyarchaeota archaeon]